MNQTATASPSSPFFSTTHWTLVMRAQGETPEAQAALSDLCAAYWTPVYRFLRREGHADDRAKELTQEFFARILAKGTMPSIGPDQGRFRSYLLGALKHFLINLRRDEGRLKRGGNRLITSLDQTEDGDVPGPEARDNAVEVPDAYFDRKWALAVIERALHTLESEHQGSKKKAQLQALKPFLTASTTDQSQSEVAAKLGLSEGAIKVAIHRLRKRFRTAVHAEIANTVSPPTDLATELRYLIEALSA